MFMVLLQRSLVTGMLGLCQSFGLLCVSVLMHVWLYRRLTTRRQTDLLRECIGLLNKSFVVIVVLSRKHGVNIWPNLSLP